MEHDRFILAHAHSVVGDQRHATLRHALVDSRNWVIYHNGRAIVPWVQHVLNIEGDWRPGIGYNPGESVKVDGFYDLPRVPLHTAVLGGGNSNIYHYTVDHLAG